LPKLEKRFLRQRKKKLKYYDYIRNPSYLKIYDRPYQSGFFWKLGNITPNLTLSGPVNIARLYQETIKVDKANYSTILHLTNVTDPNNRVIFHSYRKLNRGILGIDKQFRSYFQSKNCDFYEDAIEALKSIYDYLGTENDLYVNYQYYVNEGDKKVGRGCKSEG